MTIERMTLVPFSIITLLLIFAQRGAVNFLKQDQTLSGVELRINCKTDVGELCTL